MCIAKNSEQYLDILLTYILCSTGLPEGGCVIGCVGGGSAVVLIMVLIDTISVGN